MKIEKKDNYTIIQVTETSFEEFLSAFEVDDFSKENLFLNFIDAFEITATQIDSFSEIAMDKKEKGTSFIIIAPGIEIDDLEDETLSVVPTLIEAEDTLEMDAIERDLGL